ncbi:MAG: LysM peptidoglycan-binding domain-containing protein [Anaerolineales bacterium]|nr:LysM peptidoglycan-binding domain-containing protein [Anaerolineales bacterium]
MLRALIAFTLAFSLLLPAQPAAAAPDSQGSASEVVALINGYRAELGLPAYAQNAILSQIAQGQADWLISQGMGGVSDVHAGPGGSRPIQRAYSAGYGGGKTIFISEIVKGGFNETPAGALAWWKNSPNHNPTMIASTYQEIGAGAATDGSGRWYYVAVTGWVTGTDYTPPAAAAGEAPAAPQVVMIPVTMAEPQADGSVVHIVRTGQTLWTIAAVYDVPLEELLELNEMPEWAFVHPGDEILVLPPGSLATSTPTPGEETETPTPRPSPSPPSPTVQATAAEATATTIAPPSASSQAQAANTTVYLVVGGALLSIFGVFAASFFIQRPRPPDPDDNDPFAPIE